LADDVENPKDLTQWLTYEGKDRKYYPNKNWKVVMDPANAEASTLFKHIKDPVYAFKYFEYKNNSLPVLEFGTCFNDPNKDLAGNYLCKDGDTDIDDNDLCNFCDYGKVKCDVTHLNWTCGQRYTFYMALSNYREPALAEGTSYVKEADYSAPGFVEEDANKVLQFADWQSSTNRTAEYNTLMTNDFKPAGASTRLLTKVELDISAMNRAVASACGGKRSVFAAQLHTFLSERCYVVGGCKTDTNDNIIPQEDFDLLVDLMVEECKKRGEVNTFRTVPEVPCRYIKAPKDVSGYQAPYTSWTPASVEYGVLSGVTATNLRDCQQAVLQYRTTATGTTFASKSGIGLQAEPTLGTTKLTLFDCTGKPADFRQWMQRREVMEMPMQLMLNLPRRCDGNRNPPDPNFQCPPGIGNWADYANPNVQNNSAVAPTSGTPAPKYRSPSVPVNVQVTQENKVIVNGTERPKQ
jgi:hypothetical protein